MKTIRLYWLSIPFYLSLALCCQQIAVAADDPNEKLKKADELISKGKPKPAAVLLREVLKTNPNSAEAHMDLGAALAAQVEDNKYDEAIAEEQTALKLDPKSYGARKILGKIHANLHKWNESIAMFKEACELKPDSYSSQKDLGTAYLAAGKDDEAIAAFRKALAIKPKSVEAHVKLAVLLSKKSEYKDAIAEASEAVKLDEKSAETHLTLATIKLESGDSKGSIEPFKEAIELNGADALGMKNPLTAASGYSGLGWAIAGEKGATPEQLEQGAKNQRTAIKLYRVYPLAYIRLADILARQQRTKQADEVYNAALQLTGGDASVASPYAKFLDSVGQKNEARALLKKVLEKQPGNKQATDALAAIDDNKPKK